MRLRAIFTLCMAALWLTMQGQNAISLSAGQGHPGDELTVSLSMNGSEKVSAIEAVIPLGEWLTYVDGSASLDPTRSNGHQVSASVVDGSLRIYAYSLSLSNFNGTSGTILTFRLRLGDTAGDLDLQPSVLLSNASGASVGANATGCTVTILSPMLEIATPNIDFGHVPMLSTYQSTLTLCNVGNEPLHISDVLPSDSELSVSHTAITIPAGGTENVTVTYAPQQRVPFEASLSVHSDAANSKKYGQWQSATVVADPFSVNELYVNQASGASDMEVTVELRMNNMEPIVGAQVSFYLPDVLRYVDESASVTGRGVNHQVLTSVEGNKLTIYAYSPDNTPFNGDEGEILTFRLLLNGRNGWYWLQPEGVILSNAGIENMTSASYGEYVVIESPTIYGAPTLNFGNQPITDEMTASYTIGNSGQTSLTIDRVTFLAEGYSAKTQLPLVVEPGQETQLTIGYSSNTPEEFCTTMNVYSNDPEQRMMPVAINGAGYSPNELVISGTYNADRTTRVLTISLCNESPLAALQLDILASPADAVTAAPVIGKTDRIASHDANVYDMGNGLWRILIYSMTNRAINPGSGELMTLTFDGLDDCTFTLQNTVLSSMNGTNIESPELSALRSYQFKSPTSIMLNQETMSLQLNQTMQLSATVSPSDATDTAIMWTSSDETVATVTRNGTVSAVGVGSAVITATTFNGISAACEVTVTPILAENIVLSATELTLKPGETGQLTATILPEDTTDKTVIWSSSDKSVVTVDNAGNITAVGVGSAVVTATCGDASASCNVTVNPILAERVVLDQTSVSVPIGSSTILNATVEPKSTTDKTVTWTTSDASVVTVSPDGTLVAVGIGIASVTAKCGPASATCEVTVCPVVAQSVSLSHKEMLLQPGQSGHLAASVLPENTTDKNIVWTSSDKAVATVSTDGTVTAVSVGSAVITASCGDVSASCTVTVNPIPAEDVLLDKTFITLLVGEKTKITPTVLPESTTDKTVTWKSSDESVAIVDSDGNVTALTAGVAIISAMTNNEQTAECVVTVTEITPTSIVLNYTQLSLLINQHADLVATIIPENAADKSVTWMSSDEGVATVDNTGSIMAVGFGSAVITATTFNGISAACIVSVDKLANEIVWEQTFEDVAEGDVITLTAYATSGLPVVYDITEGSNLATLEGSSLTINAAGEIDVTASQDGDATWYAAQPVTKSIVAVNGLIYIDADDDGEVMVVNVQGYVIYHGPKADIPELPHGVYITVTKNSKIKTQR